MAAHTIRNQPYPCYPVLVPSSLASSPSGAHVQGLITYPFRENETSFRASSAAAAFESPRVPSAQAPERAPAAAAFQRILHPSPTEIRCSSPLAQRQDFHTCQPRVAAETRPILPMRGSSQTAPVRRRCAVDSTQVSPFRGSSLSTVRRRCAAEPARIRRSGSPNTKFAREPQVHSLPPLRPQHALETRRKFVQLAVSPTKDKSRVNVYHTSVLVENIEYVFNEGGIVKSPWPRSHAQVGEGTHRRVDLGITCVSEPEVALLENLQLWFEAGTYDSEVKNCNDFTDAALHVLLGIRLDESFRQLRPCAQRRRKYASVGNNLAPFNVGDIIDSIEAGGIAVPDEIDKNSVSHDSHFGESNCEYGAGRCDQAPKGSPAQSLISFSPGQLWSPATASLASSPRGQTPRVITASADDNTESLTRPLWSSTKDFTPPHSQPNTFSTCASSPRSAFPAAPVPPPAKHKNDDVVSSQAGNDLSERIDSADAGEIAIDQAPGHTCNTVPEDPAGILEPFGAQNDFGIFLVEDIDVNDIIGEEHIRPFTEARRDEEEEDSNGMRADSLVFLRTTGGDDEGSLPRVLTGRSRIGAVPTSQRDSDFFHSRQASSMVGRTVATRNSAHRARVAQNRGFWNRFLETCARIKKACNCGAPEIPQEDAETIGLSRGRRGITATSSGVNWAAVTALNGEASLDAFTTLSVHDGQDVSSSCECPVCFDGFYVGEEVRTLPCSHKYHKECIDRWLLKRPACPKCKQSILTSSA